MDGAAPPPLYISGRQKTTRSGPEERCVLQALATYTWMEDRRLSRQISSVDHHVRCDCQSPGPVSFVFAVEA
ncbi:hypothetical protein OUZ56_030464 [Daphnia magna]|uniref:Uncharacterized protein n=1 Tax=Daphnia magna TaxID=35525 RepID=A0ABQ9ZRD7_9CRUS|nr:hypothetical protein OUZ56_030464 [Daphnia magna]